MKKVTTPVLLKRDNKIIRLLNITYEKDDSIYITFPRKKGYTLYKTSEKKYEKAYEIVEVKRKLQLTDEEYNMPKISFHPRNNTMHVKSSDNKRVNSEYLLHNYSKDKRFLIIPFAQIIFPNNYEIFDDFNKTKYKDKIEISDIINNNELISLEIFIHTQNSTITEDTLPYSKNRKFKYVVSYFGDNKYSCSVSISSLPASSNNIPDILVAINTKYSSVLYSLKPN